MTAQIQPIPDKYDKEYIGRALYDIYDSLTNTIGKRTATDSLLLQSPDGSVFKVQVDNSGSLTTTAVAFGQTGAPKY